MSVTRPSSTAGSSASCWALLKRWISSRKKTVGSAAGRRRWRRARGPGAPPARPASHGAELLQGGVRRGGDDPRQRRLARAGRPVEDHRVRAALLDGAAQGRALAEQVLLARRARRAIAGRRRAASGRAKASATTRRARRASPASKSWLIHILPRRRRSALRARRVAWRRWPRTSSARRPSCCSAWCASTRSTRPATSARPQELLAGLLRDAGFEVELLGRTDERPNLVARLRGAARRPDAVPALARRHRARRPRGVAARPVVGRRRRRRAVGPRCAST